MFIFVSYILDILYLDRCVCHVQQSIKTVVTWSVTTCQEFGGVYVHYHGVKWCILALTQKEWHLACKKNLLKGSSMDF